VIAGAASASRLAGAGATNSYARAHRRVDMLDRSLVLEGKHVRLEPLRREHVDELWPAASERDIWRYMGLRVESPPDLSRWVDARVKAGESGTAIPFVHRDAATGAAFGSTSLFDIDLPNKRMEIGHTWLGASHRRTAANTESKLLMFAHAFDALGAERVQLKTDVENLRSQAAIARLGAVREGILRRLVVYADGTSHDRVMFSVIRDEWPTVRARLESLLTR